jgi:hypothetical protein
VALALAFTPTLAPAIVLKLPNITDRRLVFTLPTNLNPIIMEH